MPYVVEPGWGTALFEPKRFDTLAEVGKFLSYPVLSSATTTEMSVWVNGGEYIVTRVPWPSQ